MYNHYIVMFVIMIISGILSTMNIWVDKVEDIYFSINDMYMILLMTGWMFLFMGIYYKTPVITIIGILFVIVNLICIRTQYMLSTKQYILGMIPHHSMAIHMSKKLLDNQPDTKIKDLVVNIIKSQESEIQYMKRVINT